MATCLIVRECRPGADDGRLRLIFAPYRFPCAEVHAERAERRRVLVLRSTTEDIRPPRNLDILEIAFDQERD